MTNVNDDAKDSDPGGDAWDMSPPIFWVPPNGPPQYFDWGSGIQMTMKSHRNVESSPDFFLNILESFVFFYPSWIKRTSARNVLLSVEPVKTPLAHLFRSTFKVQVAPT